MIARVKRHRSTCFAWMIACLAGCTSQPSIVPHPVAGKVERRGKPVAEARVVFHPESDLPPGVHSPLASTDAEGRFELTTLKSGDGAPTGNYRVTVELRDKRVVGEEVVRDGPNGLPAKYSRPESTPLRAHVLPERNVVPTFTILD